MIADLESAGMSRTEIAETGGLSRQAAGKARAPSFTTVTRIEALAEQRLSEVGLDRR